MSYAARHKPQLGSRVAVWANLSVVHKTSSDLTPPFLQGFAIVKKHTVPETDPLLDGAHLRYFRRAANAVI